MIAICWSAAATSAKYGVVREAGLGRLTSRTAESCEVRRLWSGGLLRSRAQVGKRKSHAPVLKRLLYVD